MLEEFKTTRRVTYHRHRVAVFYSTLLLDRLVSSFLWQEVMSNGEKKGRIEGEKCNKAEERQFIFALNYE